MERNENMKDYKKYAATASAGFALTGIASLFLFFSDAYKYFTFNRTIDKFVSRLSRLNFDFSRNFFMDQISGRTFLSEILFVFALAFIIIGLLSRNKRVILAGSYLIIIIRLVCAVGVFCALSQSTYGGGIGSQLGFQIKNWLRNFYFNRITGLVRFWIFHLCSIIPFVLIILASKRQAATRKLKIIATCSVLLEAASAIWANKYYPTQLSVLQLSIGWIILAGLLVFSVCFTFKALELHADQFEAKSEPDLEKSKKLDELKVLYDNGVISQEEYEEEKKRL